MKGYVIRLVAVFIILVLSVSAVCGCMHDGETETQGELTGGDGDISQENDSSESDEPYDTSDGACSDDTSDGDESMTEETESERLTEEDITEAPVEETQEQESTKEETDVEDKPLANVVVVSGQSNAYGATPITNEIKDIASEYDFSNVYIRYTNINCDGTGKWKPFFYNLGFEKYRLGIGAEGSTRIGPEFGIICYLIDQGYVSEEKPLYIIKYTAAATVLNSQWLPSNTGYTTDSNGLVGDLGGQLCDLMDEYIYESLCEIEETHSPKIQSFFWVQGESDANQIKVLDGYARAEQELVSRLRSRFAKYSSKQGISFVDYAIQESEECGFTWTFAKRVNDAKKQNAQYVLDADVSTSFTDAVENEHAKIDRSLLITADKLLITKKAAGEDANDHYHLSSLSMYKLGRLMGRAMLYLDGTDVSDDAGLE